MSQKKKQTGSRKSGPPKKAPVQKRAPRPRQKMASPRIPPHVHQQLCGLMDPFCTHAIGAKLPDESAQRTLTIPVHSRSVLSTNAGGNGAVLVLPQWLYNPIVAGTIVGTEAQYLTALVPAARLPYVQSYRLVTAGVKIRCISAPLNRSGMLRVRGLPNINGNQLVGVDLYAYLVDYYEDVPLSEGNEVAVITRRLDLTSEFFRNPLETTPTGLLTDWVAPGFGAFQISVTGGPPAETVLDIETFFNFEVTFIDAEQNAILATPAPEYDHKIAAARKKASSTLKAVFKKGAKEASAHIAQKVERAAIDAVTGYFGGPSAAMASDRMIRNVD